MSKLEDRQAAAATTAAAAGEGGGRQVEAAPGGEESSPAQRPGSAGYARPPSPELALLRPRGRAPFLTDLAGRADASSLTSQPCPSPQLDVTRSPSPASPRVHLMSCSPPAAERGRRCTEPATPEDLLRETGLFQTRVLGGVIITAPKPGRPPTALSVAALARLRRRSS